MLFPRSAINLKDLCGFATEEVQRACVFETHSIDLFPCTCHVGVLLRR